MKIEIQNLCKTIKKVPILQDITVTFESGKIYGLKGKNGSGKTMLMRAISGLIIPNSGTINIDGEILGKDISFPRSIGILIENPSFLGNYTGYKNLEMLASIQKRIGEDEIRETLAEVGLDPDDKRTYRKYSLGMKQRLGIAAAIMEKPDIVILDEPINALDESGALKVREILWKLRDNGSIIILACHDAEELNLLSDEIYHIAEGCTSICVPIMSESKGKDLSTPINTTFFPNFLNIFALLNTRCAAAFLSGSSKPPI